MTTDPFNSVKDGIRLTYKSFTGQAIGMDKPRISINI